MEKKILQYSYWLGLLCAVLAILWRGTNAAGYFLASVVPGVTVYYQSFYKGAVLLLLIAVASESYMASKRQ
jgi:hypothetical protein